MRKMLLFALLMGGAIGMQAQNEKDKDFHTWDRDSDGYINEREFDNAWRDNDQYSGWDKDRNGELDENEWNNGADEYYGEVDSWKQNGNNDFDSWDGDRNGSLDEDEFRTGTYESWDVDGDGRVSEREYMEYYTLDGTTNMNRNR